MVSHAFIWLPGKYRTQLWDKQANSFLPATPGLGMHVEIKDPDTKVRSKQKTLPMKKLFLTYH